MKLMQSMFSVSISWWWLFRFLCEIHFYEYMLIKSRNYVGSIAFAILFIILAICFNWWVCKQQVLSRVVDVYCLQKYVHYIFT